MRRRTVFLFSSADLRMKKRLTSLCFLPIIFSDILVIPYALGRSVRFEVGEGPRLDPLDSPDKVGTLAAKSPLLEESIEELEDF